MRQAVRACVLVVAVGAGSACAHLHIKELDAGIFDKRPRPAHELERAALARQLLCATVPVTGDAVEVVLTNTGSSAEDAHLIVVAAQSTPCK